jgi:hypothetical protein
VSHKSTTRRNCAATDDRHVERRPAEAALDSVVLVGRLHESASALESVTCGRYLPRSACVTPNNPMRMCRQDTSERTLSKRSTPTSVRALSSKGHRNVTHCVDAMAHDPLSDREARPGNPGVRNHNRTVIPDSTSKTPSPLAGGGVFYAAIPMKRQTQALTTCPISVLLRSEKPMTTRAAMFAVPNWWNGR